MNQDQEKPELTPEPPRADSCTESLPSSSFRLMPCDPQSPDPLYWAPSGEIFIKPELTTESARGEITWTPIGNTEKVNHPPEESWGIYSPYAVRPSNLEHLVALNRSEMQSITLPPEPKPIGLLSDVEIAKSVGIEPFEEGRKRPGLVSYGVTSYGYDARLGSRFKIVRKKTLLEKIKSLLGFNKVIDPKKFDESLFVDVFEHEEIVIPPHGFVLAETHETYTIPRDCLAICVGKSTYARCGLVVNVTPLEPEWKGKITIEISNTTSFPVKIYPLEGIMQIVFLRAQSECAISYADKKGKYQDQKTITLPTV